MGNTLRGAQDGRGLAVGIVVAEFNSFITEKLLDGARRTLTALGVGPDCQDVAFVPGSFEIPVVAQRMAASGRYQAVICLGCVIRGETSHYDYVCTAVTQGVLRAGMETHVPVIFGVLTTDTAAQARARAGDDSNNKGSESAMAAVEMANLLRGLDAVLTPAVPAGDA